MRFSVLIERCSACDTHGVSVRHDEGKYTRYAEGIAKVIEKHFNGQVPVEVREVGHVQAKLGALEVWVVPEPDASASRPPWELIFSKLATKKWPASADIVQKLVATLQVPVAVHLAGFVLASPRPRGEEGRDVSPQREGEELAMAKTALAHVEVLCEHLGSGSTWTLCTDAKGRAEGGFIPGSYTLRFAEESGYDELTPSSFEVAASFAKVELHVVTTMKKKLTFYVLDQLGRAVSGLYFKVISEDGHVMSFTTRAGGKVRGTMKRGTYRAYHGLTEALRLEGELRPSSAPFHSSPVQGFDQPFEVAKTEIPQFFRLNVVRTKFEVELLLTTRFDDPATNTDVRFLNTSDDSVVACRTSDIGLLRADLPPGTHVLSFEPTDESPFGPTDFVVTVKPDGSFDPQRGTVPTKTREVSIYLITPDGEPAPGCAFTITAPHSLTNATKQLLRTDEAGVATLELTLLEPTLFDIAAKKEPQEYMPQHFEFQTDRATVTAVVARTVFGVVIEGRVVFLLDVSGSMQPYLEEMKRDITEVLLQQLMPTQRCFNLVAYSEKVVSWREDLEPATPESVDSALRFLTPLAAGGGTDVVAGVEAALHGSSVEAVFLISDGKNDITDQVLQRLSLLYYSHETRPGIHTLAINCIPHRRGWKSLKAVSLATRGVFRPVCMVQESADGLALPVTRDGSWGASS